MGKVKHTRIFILACLLWGMACLKYVVFPEVFWPSSCLPVNDTSQIEMQVPRELKALPGEDEDCKVWQAKCNRFFVDAHLQPWGDEPVELVADPTPPERVYKTLARYKVKDVVLKEADLMAIDGRPVWRYEFTGQKDGKAYEIVAASYPIAHNSYIVTYFYHAGSEAARDDVLRSIESLQVTDRKAKGENKQT